MSDVIYKPGYSRPLTNGLTEAGAITKLRQEAEIIGQPQGKKADPSRKEWMVRIKDDCVKIYESMEEANKDDARGPNTSHKQTTTFRSIPSPVNINGRRVTSPVFHHHDEVDRIKYSEENLAAAQASYSEFDNPLRDDDTPQHVKDRWVILKEIAHQKVALAKQELKLAQFNVRRSLEEQQEEIKAKLNLLNV